ncbi:MAG: DNA polymerase III subunit delta [Minisyncoccia bacterium]
MSTGDKKIHLWLGEDDFTIAEKIRGKKKDFGKKYGEMNIHEIDWKNDSSSEQDKLTNLQTGLVSESLFSSDKLLIFKNVFFSSRPKENKRPGAGENEKESEEEKSEKEEMILKYLKNPKGGLEVYFLENSIDKRKKVFKELFKLEKNNIAEVKEFSVPEKYNLDRWLEKRIEKHGGNIKKDALNILAISLGRGLAQKDKKGKMVQSYNLWEADNEIGKLVNFCFGREIAKEDVEFLVRSKVDMNIFSLTDSISLKNKSEAVLLLNMQIEMGLNEIYILTMLTRQFRNLLIIKNLLEEGLSSSRIEEKTKMHPFVVKKTIEQCRNFKLPDLKKIYRKLYDADVAIKTGKMESALALDLLVISIA